MGMTIDADRIKKLLNESEEEITNNIISIVRENYIPKADYEARLKADLVAMLSEIQMEIEEEKVSTQHLHYDDLENAESCNNGIDNCIDIIQQKINSLKAEREDKE